MYQVVEEHYVAEFDILLLEGDVVAAGADLDNWLLEPDLIANLVVLGVLKPVIVEDEPEDDS